MHFLNYWVYRNYKSDVANGAAFHYNSNQPRFHSKIELGETLWLVTGLRSNERMQYFLAARFVIRAKTHNPPNYKYGRFRLWADTQLSDYYVIGEADMTDVLLSLKFVPENPIKEGGVTIANSLQTFRYLSASDVALLEQWSKRLTPDVNIMKMVPELDVEETYERGKDALKDTLQMELPQLSDERKQEIVSGYRRNRTLVKRLNDMYIGRCQICAFDPITVYRVSAATAHHIHYLSRGGHDVLENLVLICPNHHAVIHGDDAVFDYESKKFMFSNGRQEPLVIKQHL
ncbi:MAG: HNH endonuclease [Acidobacteria bacterium]|nr:HNH endonuclease [Acidobacteriota bacterium]